MVNPEILILTSHLQLHNLSYQPAGKHIQGGKQNLHEEDASFLWKACVHGHKHPHSRGDIGRFVCSYSNMPHLAKAAGQPYIGQEEVGQQGAVPVSAALVRGPA